MDGPLGPICAKCDCNGHADTCHPETGECISLKPLNRIVPSDSEDTGDDEPVDPMFCHLRPDLCEQDFNLQTCQNHTTGPQCEQCAEGYFGDATQGEETDCASCPCPLPDNK